MYNIRPGRILTEHGHEGVDNVIVDGAGLGGHHHGAAPGLSREKRGIAHSEAADVRGNFRRRREFLPRRHDEKIKIIAQSESRRDT